MPLYLCRAKYTPAAWAALMEHPEDRRPNAAGGIEAVGGKMHGFWYALGEWDVYTLFESPDEIAAAASLVRFAGGGALAAIETTQLISVETMLEAWRKARDIKWTAPGENATPS